MDGPVEQPSHTHDQTLTQTHATLLTPTAETITASDKNTLGYNQWSREGCSIAIQINLKKGWSKAAVGRITVKRPFSGLILQFKLTFFL